MEQTSPLQLIIITGLSGAGKSTASHFFEDSGYFCMDNVPPALLPKFIQICLESNGRLTKIAVVIDARGGSFFRKLFEAIDDVKKMGVDVRILYLESSEDSLVRRFSETRRKHPLNRGGRVIDDILEERSLLETTRDRADYIIDTTSMNGRELQEEIRKFSQGFVGPRAMSVVFVSFGFKHGVPLDCDLVFDVRFLPNPFYIAQLKTLTGINKEVYDYVFASDAAKQYAQKLKDFIEFQIPLFISEPKTRLQIAIGCTGGRHRSVAFAEYLFKEISNDHISTSKIHRDLNL
ncbi:MAG: RNase adapter RapZ [Candidatus Riflebacteria bacterium]|nr:RNase adapter RapZ [Candidatus Riflebacteria bacterium]